MRPAPPAGSDRSVVSDPEQVLPTALRTPWTIDPDEPARDVVMFAGLAERYSVAVEEVDESHQYHTSAKMVPCFLRNGLSQQYPV